MGDDVKELLQLNDGLLAAEEAGARDQLVPLLGEEFTIIRAKGARQDRQAYLDAVAANAGKGRAADQPEVRVYGDCAVYRCRVATHTADGTAWYWNTRVFVRRDGGWRCVAWQVTQTQP